MTSPDNRTPNPLAFGVEAVTAALGEAKARLSQLSGQVVRLPLVALSTVLQVGERLQREYAQLSTRGQAVTRQITAPPREPAPSLEPAARPATAPRPLADVFELRPEPEPPAAEVPSPTVSRQAPAPQEAVPVRTGSPPLPNFDEMAVGSLRGRLRTLDLTTLVQLRDWEKSHGQREPILVMLDHRIAKVRGGTGRGGTEASGSDTTTP